MLRENGYNTSWFGKMHNVPDWMSSQAGPFDLWPIGLGFEYFYGFLGGDCDQWHPALYENNRPIEPYLGHPDYILDRDLADQAIAWMRMQHALAPGKPWFLYYATGTAHAPHHAPKDWIAKYKGQFDQGWDKVREETLARQIKLGVVPPDTQLTKRPGADSGMGFPVRRSEAPLCAHDGGLCGRALARRQPYRPRSSMRCENPGRWTTRWSSSSWATTARAPRAACKARPTKSRPPANGVTESLPFLLSMIDELGGPMAYNHYPVGWAHAMDAPMQWTKQVASHFGGTPQRHGDLVAGAHQGQGQRCGRSSAM